MRLFKRWFVWFQIYAIDIHIHDMKAMLWSIANSEVRKTVVTNIALAKVERESLRSALKYGQSSSTLKTYSASCARRTTSTTTGLL